MNFSRFRGIDWCTINNNHNACIFNKINTIWHVKEHQWAEKDSLQFNVLTLANNISSTTITYFYIQLSVYRIPARYVVLRVEQRPSPSHVSLPCTLSTNHIFHNLLPSSTNSTNCPKCNVIQVTKHYQKHWNNMVYYMYNIMQSPEVMKIWH